MQHSESTPPETLFEPPDADTQLLLEVHGDTGLVLRVREDEPLLVMGLRVPGAEVVKCPDSFFAVRLKAGWR